MVFCKLIHIEWIELFAKSLIRPRFSSKITVSSVLACISNLYNIGSGFPDFRCMWRLGVTFQSLFYENSKYNASYVKEVISILQNVNFRQKLSLKIKKIPRSLPPSPWISRCHWKLKRTWANISFAFFNEGFTSLILGDDSTWFWHMWK